MFNTSTAKESVVTEYTQCNEKNIVRLKSTSSQNAAKWCYTECPKQALAAIYRTTT